MIPLCLLFGCAADPIRPGGDDILLSKEAAPDGREFLDEVQGGAGQLLDCQLYERRQSY